MCVEHTAAAAALNQTKQAFLNQALPGGGALDRIKGQCQNLVDDAEAVQQLGNTFKSMRLDSAIGENRAYLLPVKHKYTKIHWCKSQLRGISIQLLLHSTQISISSSFKLSAASFSIDVFWLAW